MPGQAITALSGRSVCITGTLIFPREMMGRFLKLHDSYLDDKPRSTSSLLIVGRKPGAAKLTAAKKRESIVLTEAEFWKQWIAPSQRPPLVTLCLEELINWDQARAAATDLPTTVASMLGVGELPTWMRDIYLKHAAKYKMPSASAKSVIEAVTGQQDSTTFAGFCKENGIKLQLYSTSQKLAMLNIWGAIKDDPILVPSDVVNAVLQTAGPVKAKVTQKKGGLLGQNQMDEFVKACLEDGVNLDNYDDPNVEAMYKVWVSLSSESLSTKAVMKVVKAAAVPKKAPLDSIDFAKKMLLADPDEPDGPKKPKKDEPPPKGRLIDV